MEPSLKCLFSEFEGKKEALIPLLQATQKRLGYLPKDVLFMACRETACHVRGVPRILKAFSDCLGIEEGEITEDLEYSIETVACIGACGLAPCAMINEKVEGKLTPQKATGFFHRRTTHEITV